MTASQAPHWGLIIFMVAMFSFSFLLQLDPNITDNGGSVGISAITFPDMSNLVAAALTIPPFVTSTFGFLTGVVTFSNLGLPMIVQWAFAIPCMLIMLWTSLAFAGAVKDLVPFL